MNLQLHTFLSLADAVIITDETHTILAVNEAYEKVTGYSESIIVGKKAGVLRTPATPPETYVSMKKAIHSGRPWSGVFTNHKQNKELWHSSITITPFNIEGGSTLSVYSGSWNGLPEATIWMKPGSGKFKVHC
ncbi:PAS domain-containing protein [Paenibacillus oenotherae]|uniref:PAS domain-containing protein n=1 Tax=Paenibacillus oenotherae TaxID=1435645 RepID=UPI001FE7A6EF|nr:PAS domain-containing protein [Paenibacillus oenotherae]